METPGYDATVRHAIYIERYKARVARQVKEIIEGISAELYRSIADLDFTRMTRRDLDRLLAELRRAVQQGYEPVIEVIDNSLKEFVVYEADWQVEALRRIGLVTDLGVPSDSDLWAAMYARPFQGKLLRDWMSGLPSGTARRVRETVRQGYVDGRSAIDIARDIRGTRGRQGVMDISRRGAEAMVRTAVAHTASAARTRTYADSRVIIGEQWVSVLDHRTSAICRGRDGKIYEKGKGPRPPAHIGCRSTMVPVTRSNRAGLKSRPTYNDWLTKQPGHVQDDILGKSRGRLFREGGFSVDRFTDASGREYTLDELRSKDRAAFDEIFAD